MIRLLIEAFRLLLTRRLLTGLIAIITAGGVFVAIVASAQGIADERRILSRLDDAGTTLITVRDVDGEAALNVGMIAQLSSLEHVEWVIGLGPVLDASNVRLSGGATVPTRQIVGSSPALTFVGAWQTPAVWVSDTSQEELRLSGPAGGVRFDADRALPIVGTFTAQEPLEFLDPFALVQTTDEPDRISQLLVNVEDSASVLAAVPTVRLISGAASPQSVSVESAEVLGSVRSVVSGDLRAQGQRTLFAVLVASILFVSVVTLASVALRRRDFGRVRALGARRGSLIVLVVAQVALTSMIGAAVGLSFGAIAARRLTEEPVDLAFAVAVAYVYVIGNSLAGVGPALFAAYRDPLRVLRSA